MDNTPTWNVEQVWGSDRFYHEGDVAENMVAFVIDSGISLDTGDLNVNTEWSKSFTSSPDPFNDQMGHGTAVASIIGAKANYQGLTGVAPGAQLVSLKVFDTGGTIPQRVNRALEHAKQVIIENDLFDRAVINMSIGGPNRDQHLLVREMADMGIKIAVSAGNNADDVDNWSPAGLGDHENIYTVVSNEEYNFYSTFTNFENADDEVDDTDYTAPGTRITTYSTTGDLRTVNGTSFSAPHVAGLLLMSEIKAGRTFRLRGSQLSKNMEADPLAMFDAGTYLHLPTPKIEYVEVPVPVRVPVPVPVPVEPPQTKFVGVLDAVNKIKGSAFDDVIIGGNLNDKLKGGQGDDYIIGLGGRNKVFGGKGSDTFVCDIGDGFTIIKDFDPSEDIISLSTNDYSLKYKNNSTKVYVDDDLVAKINGIHSQIV